MKRCVLILLSLLTAAVSAAGQNHVERAMREARSRQEEMARRIVLDQTGPGKGGYLSYRVENGDTVYFDTLDPIWIFGHKQQKDWKKYYRTVWYFARVYPYALASGDLLHAVDSTLEAGHYGRMKRDRFISKVQTELFKSLEGTVRNMSINQGAVLLKLIDRETGLSSYEIIKEYKSGVAAGFWQGIASLFDNNLKAQYDPDGADRELEELVQMWEAGTFPALYRSIFWENPPEVKVPDLSKIPESVS